MRRSRAYLAVREIVRVVFFGGIFVGLAIIGGHIQRMQF
jgi:hypothetical protein